MQLKNITYTSGSQSNMECGAFPPIGTDLELRSTNDAMIRNVMPLLHSLAHYIAFVPLTHLASMQPPMFLATLYHSQKR